MILDTAISFSGMAYTLSHQNNGDYLITDSDGVMYKLIGLSQSEAFDIFFDIFFNKYDKHQATLSGVANTIKC